MRKPANALMMTMEQRQTLESWARAGTTPQRMVLRSKICLFAAEGISNNAIAKELDTSRPTVLLWRDRFVKQGLLGLSEDASHGLSPQRLDPHKVRAIVERTLRLQHPLEHTDNGEKTGSKSYQCCENLEYPWVATS